MSDLFTPSTFSKKRDNSETRLHIAVVDYLRGEIRNGRNTIRQQVPFPGLVWLHPVNEYKDKDEAYWATRKGILPGAADLLFWFRDVFDVNRPKFGAIELKTKSDLSGNQRTFNMNFEAIGGKFAVCKKVSEVRDTLVLWGLDCKNTNCIEPKLSHDEMLAMQKEIYKP